jgi:hypothetical protein
MESNQVQKMSEKEETRIIMQCVRFGAIANLADATTMMWSSVDFIDYEYDQNGLTAVYFDAPGSNDSGLALRVPVTPIN